MEQPPSAPVGDLSVRGQGLMQVKSPDQLQAEQIARQREQAALEAATDSESAASALAVWAEARFQENKLARDTTGVTEELLDGYRRRLGVYPPDKLAEFEKRSIPAIWSPKTETKCIHVEAWQGDIDRAVGDQGFLVSPTPVPELDKNQKQLAANRAAEQIDPMIDAQQLTTPEQIRSVMAELSAQFEQDMKAEIESAAKEKADAMRQAILDDLMEINFPDVRKQYRSYNATFGTGIYKGPYVKLTMRQKWNGNKPIMTEEAMLTASTPNPLDCYPSPNAMTPNGGPHVETMNMTRDDLVKLRDGGSPFARKDAIDELLTTNEGGWQEPDDSTDATRRDLERKDPEYRNAEGGFSCRELWGRVPGTYLLAEGIEVADPNKDYPFQIIWCGDKAIWVMPNPNPNGDSIYHYGHFKRIPGRIHGRSIPKLMETPQDIANASVRSMCKNMALSCDAMWMVDFSQVPENERKNMTEANAGKVFIVQRKLGMQGDPVKVFLVPDRSASMIAIDAWASNEADAITVPSYAYGSDQGRGAAETVGGLDRLLKAASMSLKESLESGDHALEEMLGQWYTIKMIYDPRESIKGDCKVTVRATIGLLQAELNQAKIDDFMTKLASPAIMEMWGPKPLDAAMREYARLSVVDTAKILPPEEEVKRRIEERQKGQQESEAAEAKAKQAEAEAKAAAEQAKLEVAKIEAETAQIEAKVKMAELEMRMRATERAAVPPVEMPMIAQ